MKKYAEGALSEDEHMEVTVRMVTDPEWAAQAEALRASHLQQSAAVPPPLPPMPPPIPTAASEQQFGEVKNSPVRRERIIAVAVLLIGMWMFYRFVTRLMDGVGEVSQEFKENFDKPKGIMDDLLARPLTDSAFSALDGPCAEYLTAADGAYKKGDLEKAQRYLVDIVVDSSMACQSEAWFFIGVIRLESGDPRAAIDCFSKIEDMERFRDDINWYNALAMVQLAEDNASLRKRAAKALKRILDQPDQPEARKEKARKLIESYEL